MDPRALRSRTALRGAVLSLAERTPVASLTVAEVCRHAGVTRDTFYRHASGPTELVAAALAAEIEALPERDRLGDAERDLIVHIHARREVYRHAMSPTLAAPVRAQLERVLAEGLHAWLDEHPDLAPEPVRTDAAARDIAVAYAAGGTVAALEAWLRRGDDAGAAVHPDDDIETATRAILVASPEWWLRTRGRDERREP